MTQVVTYQDDRGGKINVCPACEARLKAAGDWPRNAVGEEYCQVSHGLHRGKCDLCQPVYVHRCSACGDETYSLTPECNGPCGKCGNDFRPVRRIDSPAWETVQRARSVY